MGDEATAGRPTGLIGLRSIILEANVTLRPVNAMCYALIDFYRDTLQRAAGGGGRPDVLVVSTAFLVGFATWGLRVEREGRRRNAFGVLVPSLRVNALGGVAIVEAATLPPYSAVALTSEDVTMRHVGPAFPRPRRFLDERDYSLVLEVGNEGHHAWLEGVTGLSMG